MSVLAAVRRYRSVKAVSVPGYRVAVGPAVGSATTRALVMGDSASLIGCVDWYQYGHRARPDAAGLQSMPRAQGTVNAAEWSF